MIKIIKLKNISPQQALESVQTAGIFGYMINWGCEIDEKNNRLIFNLKHGGGGGTFEKELQKTVKDLEAFINSLDTK
jgi:hypothetical protein